jgi:hypothetical protein|tara:strand:+ start:1269 stop:2456 length:1188 start_codon:yes stop_codon:yes gene_type:complete
MFATISGSVLALTSDHVVFIFPALVLSYLFFNPREIDLRKFKFPNLSYLILPLVIILLFYGSWSLLKFVQYSQYEFYPNGHSGMPIHIQDLGILQTISPQFFEDYHGTVKADYKFVDFAKKLAFNLGYMLNLEPFDIPRGLNFTTMKYLLSLRHIAYMFIIYLPLALLTIYGFIAMIRDFLKSKKIYNNTNLYLLLLFLVFIFPIIQSTVSPRYILTSYIFLFYFISYGIVTLFEKKFKMKIITKIIALIVVLLIILVPFWYLQNNYVVLFSDKEISAQNTGNFINANIPKDAAIMAQAGYTVKLNYLTDNRVLGLYAVPERLPDLIDFFNVSYVVVGRYYTYDAYHLAKDSVEYVRDNPDEFELIATIEEDYSNFFVEDDLARTDEVYIYKVKN